MTLEDLQVTLDLLIVRWWFFYFFALRILDPLMEGWFEPVIIARGSGPQNNQFWRSNDP